MKNREQFLADRKKGIGGSDIAAIMGLSPWKTAYDVYLDKVTDHKTPDNPAMQRGRRFEKYVLYEYSRHNNVELETDLPMFKDSEYPFLIGHVDAKIKGQNIIVEAKTSSGSPSSWGGQIPIYYKTQVAHYAYLTDCDYVDVAVLFLFSSEYRQFTYYRDKEFEAQIRQAAIDFWINNVLKNEPPALVGIEDTRKLYHKSIEGALEAGEDLRSLVIRLAKLEQDKHSIDTEADQIKLRIMQAMGEHDSLIFDNTPLITWKSHTRHEFDSHKFREDHPELYEKYLKSTERRPFKLC